MYIRIKRDKTTYFIRCKPSDKILDIKEKLQELIDQPVNDQRLILPGTGEVLEDAKTLADQKIETDAVVALTLRKEIAYLGDSDSLQSERGDYTAVGHIWTV
ncbi:ubiquitin family protein [Trifolium pratense]|uniref:Ubiquitin family protein n=1 Tax=Trifolium pratense TaxID=57577 RepID=A0A2K3PP68_TRIPR|nr:ubiquitin family protein [Trifolium pratense]